MKKLFLILLFTGSKLSAQTIQPFMGVYTASAPTWTEIRIDTRLSGTTSASTYNTLAVDPKIAVGTVSNLVDITGFSTGVSISTIATANWGTTTGSCANNAITGITTGTIFTGATADVYQSVHYSNGTVSPARYDATKAQYHFAGLPAGNYSIKIGGNEGTLGFDATNGVFRAVGSTASSIVEYDGGPGGGGGATSVTTFITLTFDVDGTGVADLWMNTMASGGGGSSDLALNCGFILIKN